MQTYFSYQETFEAIRIYVAESLICIIVILQALSRLLLASTAHFQTMAHCIKASQYALQCNGNVLEFAPLDARYASLSTIGSTIVKPHRGKIRNIMLHSRFLQSINQVMDIESIVKIVHIMWTDLIDVQIYGERMPSKNIRV